jgi:hypothetical protein
MTNVPLLYVRGNHDRGYDRKPPLGCTDIDDKIYDFNGLRILGLGGSIRYHEGPDMYTEAEMLESRCICLVQLKAKCVMAIPCLSFQINILSIIWHTVA